MTLSVIMPSFNYAEFLPRRIDSILHQTIPPDEIIFLDDCSTDDSVMVAEELLSKSSIPYRIFTNTENQGVFKQWLKGIALVEHDLFWIVEADDYCEATFIEYLLPAFDDEAVILSYCQSNIVETQAGSQFLSHGHFAPYLDIDNFTRDHVDSANTVLQDQLVILNAISNASAVVVRTSACDMNVISPIKNYACAGDWLFNLLLLESNKDKKIAFTARNLNYWVRHPACVWSEEPENVDRRYKGSCEVIGIYLDLFSRYQLSYKQRFQILKLIYDIHLKPIMGRPEEGLFVSVCEDVCGTEVGSQIAQFLVQAKAAEEDLVHLQRECSSQRDELDRRRQEGGDKDSRLSWLTEEFSKVHRSLSWRITRPLRFIHDLF